MLERLQVFAVATAVGQLDVERAALFAEGEVLRSVHREGEDVGIAGEDRGGAVALVHIEVDHGGPPDPSFVLQGTNGDRMVVEGAVALAVIGESMVRPTGEISRRTVFQRGEGGSERPARRGSRTQDQLRAPGESKPALIGIAQGPVDERSHVRRRVDEEQAFDLDRLRLAQVGGTDEAIALQDLPEHPVLPDGKAMAHGQRHEVFVAVEHPHPGAILLRRAPIRNGLRNIAHRGT